MPDCAYLYSVYQMTLFLLCFVLGQFCGGFGVALSIFRPLTLSNGTCWRFSYTKYITFT